MISLSGGIRFGDHFAVDPTRKTGLAVVSHAHWDHVRAHDRIVATPATLDLVRLKYRKFEAIPLEYHKRMKVGPATIELAPAGHMLGSAQVLIDCKGERVVYTGDFKLRENVTCPPAKVHRCDVLLIDATYGKSHYRFPSHSECCERLADFAHRNLKAGITPIVLAYSSGKSQEAMKILGEQGFEIEAHENACAAASVYRKHGVRLGKIYEFNERPTPGRVLILPPTSLRYTSTRGWGRFRTCFLSGWAVDKNYGCRGGRSTGIPFSDHASFDEIVEYVENARPKRVYTLFGPADIADYLRRVGFKAQPIDLNSGKTVSSSSTLNLDLFSQT